MIKQSPSWIHIQERCSSSVRDLHPSASLCLLQHCSQQSSNDNNLSRQLLTSPQAKCGPMYTMELCLVTKKEEISFATIWIEMEVSMLNRISQVPKDKYHMISLTCRVQKEGDLIGVKSTMVVTRGQGRRWRGRDKSQKPGGLY